MNIAINRERLRRKMKKLLCVSLVLVSATICHAYVITDIVSEGTYGVGTNTGLLVVDFWPTGDDSISFAFVVNFDGIINGFELMDIVAGNNEHFTYSAPGGFLEDVWYTDLDGNAYHSTNNWPDSFWSQWNSSDWGRTWTDGGGANADTYGDGDTLGWLAQEGGETWPPSYVPVTPIPEPVTLVLLGLGSVALSRRVQV